MGGNKTERASIEYGRTGGIAYGKTVKDEAHIFLLLSFLHFVQGFHLISFIIKLIYRRFSCFLRFGLPSQLVHFRYSRYFLMS